eukprot:387728-Pyramimonas_sp.AAC.1
MGHRAQATGGATRTQWHYFSRTNWWYSGLAALLVAKLAYDWSCQKKPTDSATFDSTALPVDTCASLVLF